MKKLLISSYLLFCIFCAFAQTQKYKAKIPGIDTPGFYRILLMPEVVANTNPEQSDLRLIDNDGRQTPYILQSELQAGAVDKAINLPIISRRKQADSLMHILVQNTSADEITEVWLTIGNTGANRSISISGSDDSLTWYVIRENIELENSYQQKNKFVHTMSLPATNYKLYNIVINGKTLLPVNILEAGTVRKELKQGSYQQLPVPGIRRFVRSNISYAEINFGKKFWVDRLGIEFEGSRLFERTLEVFNNDTTRNNLLGSFQVSSKQPTNIPLRCKTSRFIFRIDNQDNPLLNIKSVVAFQLNKSIVAYLEPDRTYEIFYGDSTLKAPQYDLDSFADSVGEGIRTLSIGDIQNLKQPSNPKEFDNKLLLWLAIIIGLIVLLAITWKMLNEAKKKETGQ